MSREALYSIRSISAKSSDASALIDELDHYLNGLYPSESNHLESPQNLDDPNCIFLGAFKDEKLIAMGAAKLINDYAELKRFFVTKDFRGSGVAECILSVLEIEILKKDISNIYLETGVHQKAALKFYENLGYAECEPFGVYKKDPLSVFMNKNIGECEFILNDIQDSYYIVAFSSLLKKGPSNYSGVADRMVELVKKQEGFLGMISTRNVSGRGFTSSYWSKLDAIAEWKENNEHLAAQQLGESEFYKKFKISKAKFSSDLSKESTSP